MDSKIIHAACMRAAVTVIATGVAIIEQERNRNYIPREPRINAIAQREFYMDSILNRGDRHCVEQIRMKPFVLYKLCDVLTSHDLLRSTQNVSIREQVIVFLQIVGQNQRFRFISGIYYRSVETIHRYFRIVLKAVLKLYKHLIKDPGDTVPAEILNNRRFYPYFKDCVGAIDGTHVPANVPVEIQGKFRGRKEGTTQNVLAAITFDLKFIYVLAGWEGSAHDSRVLGDALSRPNGLKIPEEMSTTQNEKCKGKHFTWSKPMSHMLLEILAEEALKGNKPSSTFRAESFVKVATEISQKFNVQCEPKHVDNHLKTVKKEWGIITKLKNKSGFGWDDCLKMITVSKDVYDEEVKAHPNHDKYLNKKLDMYEAMTIVVGKDMATGNYAKSYADVNLEENTEEQSISIENEGEYEETSKGKETSSSSTQKRQHRKRNRMYEDDGVEKLSKQIGDVALAIQSLSKNQLDVNALYAEVMKIEGFDEITLGEAFDHLVQNEMLAKAFMAKNANLRKIWVQNFVNQHYYRPAC